MPYSTEALVGESLASNPLALFVLILIIGLGTRFLVVSLKTLRGVEIRGIISAVDRGNVIEINAGSRRHVSPGQIFVIYKRMAMKQVVNGATYTDRVVYTPVGRAKVVSATRHSCLCTYRPIDGFSNAPSLGDTAFYSSRLPVGKVVPLTV